jgi:hypothetical protein
MLKLDFIDDSVFDLALLLGPFGLGFTPAQALLLRPVPESAQRKSRAISSLEK